MHYHVHRTSETDESRIQQDARAALSANNHELKRRRIAVTLADTRVKGKDRNVQTETGLGRLEDILSRSVRIKNLPPGTQEGLLQQVLEQHAIVKRVEIFEEINMATVELENISVRPKPAAVDELLMNMPLGSGKVVTPC